MLGLSTDNTTVELKRNIDKNGNIHTRYRQQYKNIPIWGKQLILHEDNQGNIWNLTGEFVRALERDFMSPDSLVAAKNASDILNMKKSWVDSNIKAQNENEEVYFESEQIELVIYLDEKDNPTKPITTVLFPSYVHIFNHLT